MSINTLVRSKLLRGRMVPVHVVGSHLLPAGGTRYCEETLHTLWFYPVKRSFKFLAFSIVQWGESHHHLLLCLAAVRHFFEANENRISHLTAGQPRVRFCFSSLKPSFQLLKWQQPFISHCRLDFKPVRDKQKHTKSIHNLLIFIQQIFNTMQRSIIRKQIETLFLLWRTETERRERDCQRQDHNH